MATKEQLSKTQKERLSHIDFKAFFLGAVGRKDIQARFGMKEAAATRDFAKYNEIAPRNLVYDPRKKQYIPSDSFKPVFSYSTSRVLSTLAEGFGDGLKESLEKPIAFDTPVHLNRPNLKCLAIVCRAISNRKVIRISYSSLASGDSEREIAPFALVDNGLRWHVRAFDRKRNRFADFVLTRIDKPKILDRSEVLDSELPKNDQQWNTNVSLEIVPHPNVAFPKAIERDYGMRDGILKVNLRSAVVGYVLRRWNVDCSLGHTLQGKEFHLALNNRDALDVRVDTMTLAPGFGNADA